MGTHKLIIIAVLLALASSIGLSVSQAPGTNASMNQTIEITKATLQPNNINVSAGTTVTWINRDATPNIVRAVNGDFTSGSLATGQSFSHTFNSAGTFDYVVNNSQNRGTVRVTSGVTGTAGITQNQTAATQNVTQVAQNQTIGASQAPIVVRGREPVVVGQTQPIEVRPQQAHVQVEQPQSVLVRTEPVITRGGANATQVTPQTVTGSNTTPVVVREEQAVLVREPQQVVVQPQPVEVTVEQPQPVVVRTVPVVSMTGTAGNQTIGAANVTAEGAQASSVVVLNRTGAATAPVVAQGTVPVVVGKTQPVVVEPLPTQIQVEQPQPVVIRTETTVTRSGTNVGQVGPQVVPRTNQSPQVVSETQQIVVREPEPVVVQPQPVQVSVEQPQTIVIRTVPVVTIANQTIGTATANINQTIGTANASTQNQTATSMTAAGTAQRGIIGNATGGNQTPYIRAARQSITTDSVTIAEVYSNGPGWADVHTDLNGMPNPTNIIGFTHVNNGLNRNVVVVLNRTNDTNITDPLWAMLHVDAGRIGIHEYPGPDVEASAPNGTGVRVPFNVTASGTRFRIAVAGNASSATSAGNASAVRSTATTATRAANVTSTTAANVTSSARAAASAANATVTAARNATSTARLAAPAANVTRAANATTATNVTRAANVTRVTNATKATTATRAANVTRQAPVTPAAPAVSAPSAAVGEPYVQVSNQSVSSGRVTVAQASAQGPSWVAVQSDLNGSPGKILGYSHLNSGMNNNVAVALQFLNQTSVTSVLWAQLYKDGGAIGQFEYPGPDVMITTSNGTQVRTSFGVTGANQVVARQGTTGFAGAGNMTSGNQTAAGGQMGMSRRSA